MRRKNAAVTSNMKSDGKNGKIEFLTIFGLMDFGLMSSNQKVDSGQIFMIKKYEKGI